MSTFLTSARFTPAFFAICPRARLWSSRVSAEKFFLGTLLAYLLATRQFVLAGFPEGDSSWWRVSVFAERPPGSDDVKTRTHHDLKKKGGS